MRKEILLFNLFFMTLCLGPLTAQETYYVDSAAVAGLNNGSSWEDAYTDLQDALAASEEGDEIWVAEGTYFPGDNPEATFLINTNITLLGGFPAGGGDGTIEERDPTAHETILSGDLNGDDVDDDFDNFKSDNVMTVVEVANNITNATEIDGFKIRNGYSNGNSWPNEDGAAIHSEGTPVIRNCFFTQNYAKNQGGAILHNTASAESIVIESCVFEKNTSAFGGAIYVYYSDYQIVDCRFSENIAVPNAGGGMLANGASGTISNCLFEDNMSGRNGGGIFVFSWTDINDVTLTLENCTFAGNTAENLGGGLGLIVSDSIQAIVRNCILRNNSSPTGAAVGMSVFEGGQFAFTENANILFENCLLTGNTGNEVLGIHQIGPIQLLNCTVASNDCFGINHGNQSVLEIQNSILYNPGYEEYIGSTEAIITSNGGNLIFDTSLDDLLLPTDKSGIAPDFDSDYLPTDGGNLVNAGINAGVTALLDLGGNERIQYEVVDIGAYESPFLVVSTREIVLGEIELYPNPAFDILHIELPETVTQPVEVSLFDNQVRLMSRQILSSGQVIDVEGLAPGIYWVKAVAEDIVYSGRFIKR